MFSQSRIKEYIYMASRSSRNAILFMSQCCNTSNELLLTVEQHGLFHLLLIFQTKYVLLPYSKPVQLGQKCPLVIEQPIFVNLYFYLRELFDLLLSLILLTNTFQLSTYSLNVLCSLAKIKSRLCI